jgi:tryptophan synthase alpha chain
MTRLKKLFDAKSSKVLNVYCTAGYPTLDSTLPIIAALEKNGADLVEIGMPYSDPLADGPVIQESGAKALENGMSIEVLLEQLKSLRATSNIPVVLMGYMNPVLQFGFEKFCAAAAAVGVDGLILPDMPAYEFETKYGAILKKHHLDFIFLVTPETPTERIQYLDSLSSGFLYAVSASATTGSALNFDAVDAYLQKLKQLQLNNPILVGFGVKDAASFELASRHTAGAIIGSAFIKALENSTDVTATTAQFLSSIMGKS